MNIAKLLTLTSLFQDVTEEVKKAGLEKRPWYMQRTAIGSIIALVSGALAAFSGMTLDQINLDTLGDNITNLITVSGTVYGSVLGIYGLIMKVISHKKESST